MKGTTNKQQSGFSLVETLVAFTILVLTVTVVFQIYNRGTRSTKLSSEYIQAILIAQSQLALFQVGSGQKTGLTNNHFRWNIKENKIILPEVSAVSHSYNNVHPYNITVNITWPSFGFTRSIQLNTVRLGI